MFLGCFAYLACNLIFPEVAGSWDVDKDMDKGNFYCGEMQGEPASEKNFDNQSMLLHGTS